MPRSQQDYHSVRLIVQLSVKVHSTSFSVTALTDTPGSDSSTAETLPLVFIFATFTAAPALVA